MSLGRRKNTSQQEFWVATNSLPNAPRHVFYERLNGLLSEGGFDEYVESLCEPYYAKSQGRPGIPPGVYFRMLFVGYFEGIDSQRGIAWRCADSRSLASFLGYKLDERTPDHSSLTRIRKRLPLEVHEDVFAFVLWLAEQHGLLSSKTVAVDSTLLEANAAMKSIVRRETGEDWKEYLRRLAEAEGVEIEDDEDLRKFDKTRKIKKVANRDWESPSDPDARMMKMKDGRTRLSYKAEHTVDLDSEFILDATVYHGHFADSSTLAESLSNAELMLEIADVCSAIEDVVADKGYHKNKTLAECREAGYRTYIPEPALVHQRRWTDKPAAWKTAVYENRRRLKRERGKLLQRQRSERTERSFAHVCETGGARRTWLRGLVEVNQRHRIVTAARNLGLMMRALFGFGKPRCLQGGLAALLLPNLAIIPLQIVFQRSQITLKLGQIFHRRTPVVTTLTLPT